VEALHNAPPPTNVTELKRFLGHLTFYDRFCKNRASVAAPLYELLKKQVPIVWGKAQQRAFQETKELLCSEAVLAQYSLDLPIAISCDSSLVGCGAVLYNIYQDGSMRPVMYVSKAFSDSQRKWSVFEREFVACVFAVTRLHEFIAGRSFFLFTEHKPVVQFLKKRIPEITTPWVLRGLLVLGSYACTPVYRSGAQNADADNLSSLIPAENKPTEPFFAEVGSVLYLAINDEPVLAVFAENSPVPPTAKEVASLAPTDPEIGQVYTWASSGWPTADPGGVLSHYYKRREAISIRQGCLLWGERVIVPLALREDVLNNLHSVHMGAGKTKALARLYAWFPNITEQLEGVVASCTLCQEYGNALPARFSDEWGLQQPWGRLHIDFAGPYHGAYLVVLVDATTGWVEAQWCNGPTSAAAIQLLRSVVARFGLPDTIVSDNAPAFRGSDWVKYLKALGIRVMYSSPYAPFQNGLVERAIKTSKQILEKFSSGTRDVRLANALAIMRFVPADNGPLVAERLLGWQPALPLAHLVPTEVKPPPPATPDFVAGDSIWFERFPIPKEGPKWLPGTVTQVRGSSSKLFDVCDLQGMSYRRARGHLKRRACREVSKPLHYDPLVGSDATDLRHRWYPLRSPTPPRRPHPPSRPWEVHEYPSSPERRSAEGPAPARHRLRPAGLQTPTRSDADSSDGEEPVRPVRPAGARGNPSFPPSIGAAPVPLPASTTPSAPTSTTSASTTLAAHSGLKRGCQRELGRHFFMSQPKRTKIRNRGFR